MNFRIDFNMFLCNRNFFPKMRICYVKNICRIFRVFWSFLEDICRLFRVLGSGCFAGNNFK